jgi:hypothetical protein
MRFVVIFLVLYLAGAVEIGETIGQRNSLPPECRSFHNASRYNLLSCWLYYLTVPIPDQTFRTSIFSLGLKDFQCSNFTVGSMESAYRKSNDSNDAEPYLDIVLQNVSAVCHGSYDSTGGLDGKVTASAIGMQHALDLSCRVLSNATATPSSSAHNTNMERPVAVQTVNCATAVKVQDLHFSGSISAKIVDFFRNSIAAYVSDALQSQLCSQFPGTVDPWLTLQLQQLNAWLDQYLPDEQQLPLAAAASSSNRLIDLTRDVPSLVQALDWINRVAIEPHLHEGFLPHDWLNASSNRIDDVCENDGDCELFFNGWNGVIKSIVPTDGLSIGLPPKWKNIRFVLASYGAVELQLQNLTVVSGLDQWSRLQLLDIHDAHTIGTATQTHNVSVRTDMKVVVQAIPGGIFQGDDLEESFSIHANVSSFEGVLNIGIELLRDALQGIPVDALLSLVHGLVERNYTATQNALACLIPAVQSLQVTTFDIIVLLHHVSFEPHIPKQATNQLESDLDTLFNNVLRLILQEYQTLVTATILGLTQGPGLQALDVYLYNATSTTNGECDAAHHEQFKFTNLLTRMNNFLGRNDTLARANRYVDCVSTFLSRVIEERLVSSAAATPPATDSPDRDIDDNGQLFQLLEFRLKDTGSLRSVQLLSPQSDSDYLSSTVSYGSFSEQERPRLLAAADVRYAPLNLTSTIHVEVSLDNVSISGGSAFSYKSGQLGPMSLLEVMQHGECALAPASLELHNVDGSLGQFKTIVRASFSHPTWSEPVNITFNSTDYPSIEKITSYWFEWMVTSIGDMFEATSRTVVVEAQHACVGKSFPDEKDDDGFNYSSIFLVIGAVILFSQPVLLLIKQRHVPHEYQEDDRLEEPLLLPRQPSRDMAEETPVRPLLASTALMQSKSIPYLLRLLTPMLILCTIALLLSSNLSVGATVDLVVSFDGRTFRSPPLFSFSLFNTAKEMLQARIYPLFLLVLVFSGIWPYVKLLLLLFSWVAPKNALSVRRRGKLLLALDALGKFSLVDTYVMVLMLVAFRYHLDLSQREGSDLDVFVAPQFGFFGFLAATTLSLLAGHILVFSHRQAELKVDKQSAPSEPLFEHSFRVKGEQRQLSRLFQVTLVFVFVMTTTFLGVGITKKSFIFEFGGLAGAALGDGRRSSYSLLTLGTSIYDSVENPATVGIIFLQVAYYFYAVVMPFCCLLFLVFLLLWPMTVSRQLTFITLAEITNAWSAVEVFVLSILAALLEISKFAAFIVGERCALIDKILADQGKELDLSTCYSVTSTVSWDGAFLIVAVLLNSAWVSVVLRLAHLALEERIRDLRDNDGWDHFAPKDEEPPTFAEQLAAHRCTGWMIAPSMMAFSRVASRDDDAENDEVVGPPVLATPGREGTGVARVVALAWQSPQIRDAFEEEWRESAEKDPAWKAWKEATNVT